MGEHDYSEAFTTLCQLRDSPLQVAKELLFLHVQMVIEQRHILGDKILANTADAPPEFEATGPGDKVRLLS